LAGKTFAAKKSGRTNFQTGNFCPENISDRTGRNRSAGPDFPARDASVVMPAPKTGFSGFRGDRFKNFWRESSYERKNSGPNARKKGTGRQGSYFPPTFRIRSIETTYKSRIR
jgi:hypothetical protein